MALLAAASVSAVAVLSGCQAVGFVASEIHRNGDHEVKTKYHGLDNKNFAVIVAADRAIQADFPDAVTLITAAVARRLADPANGIGASGMVAPDDVLKFQAQHPGWVSMSPVEVAKKLGVDRLVFIDLQEYTLTDPGNPYLWAGRAAATVGVVEADSDLGQDMAFREYISVKFPDNDSTSPQEMPGTTVQQRLLNRFVDRASWLFYDHDEANIIKY
jgi:hypothetical protein